MRRSGPRKPTFRSSRFSALTGRPNRAARAFRLYCTLFCGTLSLSILAAGCNPQQHPVPDENRNASQPGDAATGKKNPKPTQKQTGTEGGKNTAPPKKDRKTIPQTNWPVFRGNPTATGVATEELSPPLQVVWKKMIPNSAVEATAVIAEERVFVGDAEGTFFAIDLATGKQLWKYTTEEDSFNAAAAVREGLVYVGSVFGLFFCFDAKEGSLLWKYETDGEINGGPNFYKNNVLIGSQDATLYCLDARTGKEVWKHAIDDQIRCAPTVVENRCFLAGCDGKLHVINLDDGSEVGTVAIDSPTGSTPAALGNRVYFGTEDGTFFCIDWKKLQTVWKYRNPKKSLAYRSSAAATKELIFFGGRDRMIHAVETDSGNALWTYPTKRNIDSSPVLAGNVVYVAGGDGRLIGLDRKTGKSLWQYEAGGEFTASPAIASGKLVIGNMDGTLYCFQEQQKE